MSTVRHVRWCGRLAAAMLCGVLAGCAGDDAPERVPAGAASPKDAVATTAVPTRSEDHPRWRSVDGLQVPRDDFGTAVIDREIWVLGGMTGERGNRVLSIEVLDTRTGHWRTSGIEMPVGLASFEVIADGPRIHVFGGFDALSRPTTFAAVLDTRTGRWRDLPAMPRARYAHTVTRYEDQVFVIGGRDDDGPVAEVDVFDLETRRWSTARAPMANARDSHDTVLTPDGLVVVGGWLDYEPTDLVDVYDPETDTWTEGPRLPQPISRAGVAFADGRIWTSYHETSFVLEPSGEWHEANALPLSRHGLGYVRVGDHLYAIGGCALNPLRDVRTVDRLALA